MGVQSILGTREGEHCTSLYPEVGMSKVDLKESANIRQYWSI